jgi:hypothetical protein
LTKVTASSGVGVDDGVGVGLGLTVGRADRAELAFHREADGVCGVDNLLADGDVRFERQLFGPDTPAIFLTDTKITSQPCPTKLTSEPRRTHSEVLMHGDRGPRRGAALLDRRGQAGNCQ